MKTKLNDTTKNYIKSKLYKVCAGEDVNSIMRYYKHNCIWGHHDILKVLIHACSENSSVEDICDEFQGPSADTICKSLAVLLVLLFLLKAENEMNFADYNRINHPIAYWIYRIRLIN